MYSPGQLFGRPRDGPRDGWIDRQALASDNLDLLDPGELHVDSSLSLELRHRSDHSIARVLTSRGGIPFRPRVRQELERYHEVPVEIAEDATALVRWARAAIAVAGAAPTKKPRAR